jgi:ketosteroid isomerase-like protein
MPCHRTNVVVGYLAALDRGDLTAAEACFPESAVHAVPAAPDEPIPSGCAVRWGRDAIAAHFRARGVKPYRHEVSSVVDDGARCFVAGRVAGSDGRIASYVTVATTLPAPDVEELLR